jgi:carboxyl-terminal processing protease
LPDFLLAPDAVDALLDRILPFRTVVLDLRGNTGGLNESLDRFVAGFFKRDVKVAEFKGREQSRQEIARSRKERAFRGKLIVLVNSETSSAAEVFARLVQLEKRGIVLGDRTRGAVMQGQMYQHTVQLNAATVARYGVEISTADVIMSDGKSLEHVGVIPDETILPSVTDIAQGNDPVLARAAELAGLKMTAPNSVNVLRAALGE